MAVPTPSKGTPRTPEERLSHAIEALTAAILKMGQTSPHGDPGDAWQVLVNNFHQQATNQSQSDPILPHQDLRPNPILDEEFGDAPASGNRPPLPPPPPQANPSSGGPRPQLPPPPVFNGPTAPPVAAPVKPQRYHDDNALLESIRQGVWKLYEVTSGQKDATGKGNVPKASNDAGEHPASPWQRIGREILGKTRVGRIGLNAWDRTKPFRQQAAKISRGPKTMPSKTGGGHGKPPAAPPSGGTAKPPVPAGAGAAAGGEAAAGVGAAEAGMAVPVVGVVVAVTVALVALAKAAHDFAYQMEGQTRKLAQFSPSQAANVGILDAQRARRGLETGEATAATGQGLTQAIDRWEKSIQPIEKLATNVGNIIGSTVMNSLASIAEAMDPLVKALTKLALLPEEKEQPTFGNWLGDIARNEDRKEAMARDRIRRAQQNGL